MRTTEEINERIDTLRERVTSGRMSIAELPWSLRALWFAGYLDGIESNAIQLAERDRTIALLNDECDRRYSALFSTPNKLPINEPSFAELLRRRGQLEEADRVESEMAALRFNVRGAA